MSYFICVGLFKLVFYIKKVSVFFVICLGKIKKLNIDKICLNCFC